MLILEELNDSAAQALAGVKTAWLQERSVFDAPEFFEPGAVALVLEGGHRVVVAAAGSLWGPCDGTVAAPLAPAALRALCPDGAVPEDDSLLALLPASCFRLFDAAGIDLGDVCYSLSEALEVATRWLHR